MKSKVAVIVLGVLLAASTLLWSFQIMDAGVTITYMGQEAYDLRETQKQLMASLKELADNNTKQEILEAASRHSQVQAFEKEGYTWVGWIGFRFDAQDRLESICPVSSGGEEGSCYPGVEDADRVP